MIRLISIDRSLFVAVFSITLSLPVVAQLDSAKFQIVSPFDSLSINNLKARGNPQNGSVQVTLEVQSDYHKLAQVDFGGGAFGDFGATDDKGRKYKYSSYDGPPGMSYGVNKGYARITGLQFGKTKVTILISVQDTLHTGQSQTLSFRLSKMDKAVKQIKEIHILTTLRLNYMFAGQKETILKNIPIEWVQPKNPVAAKKA